LHDTGTSAARLGRLEEILATPHNVNDSRRGDDIDPVEVSLRSVLTERIRKATAELERSRAAEIDAIEACTMRLLLSDYQSAVQHLRAVVRTAEGRLTGAAAVIKRGGRLRELSR
jgi:hypothetical protein